jgi:hypothetical protein
MNSFISRFLVLYLCYVCLYQIQMNDEVNEQMAQPIGPQMDEDELNAELEEMENELMDQQLLAAPAVPVTNKQPGTYTHSKHALQHIAYVNINTCK